MPLPDASACALAAVAQLVDDAHGYGIRVLFELVHSHASSNVADGLNNFDGSSGGYFIDGPDGWHAEWGTRMFDFSKVEVLRFLVGCSTCCSGCC